MYRLKHLVSILYTQDKDLTQTLDSYCRNYGLDEDRLRVFRGMLMERDPTKILSSRYLRSFILHGEASVTPSEAV